MANIYKLVFVMVVAMAVVIQVSRAAGLCDMTQQGLNDCKPSVTKPNPTKPTPECCAALKGADLKCLCGYKNSVVLPSLGIDPDLAMGLPVKCDLTPPADC